jgi:hypothetical protein
MEDSSFEMVFTVGAFSIVFDFVAKLSELDEKTDVEEAGN